MSRERDKRIAELKGWKIQDAMPEKPNQALWTDRGDKSIYEDYKAGEIQDVYLHMLPFWESDRNDAWELWDELPKPKRYEERREQTFSEKTYHLIKFEEPYPNGTQIRGTSFADAVSKAWIAWKEASNE